MAGAASPISHSLYANRQLLAQSVERFFADVTQNAIRDGSFTSVRQLITAIEDYLALRNEQPKRYLWRAKGEEILAKIRRARLAQAAVT